MAKKTEKSTKTHVIVNSKHVKASKHKSADFPKNSNTNNVYNELKGSKKEEAIKECNLSRETPIGNVDYTLPSLKIRGGGLSFPWNIFLLEFIFKAISDIK